MSADKVTSKFQRQYSGLNILTVFCALTVIFFHCALPYLYTYHKVPWPFISAKKSLILTYFAYLANVYCMKLFFMLAGYFASRTYQRHSLSYLVVSRAKKMLAPFLVFWLLPNLINFLILLGINVHDAKQVLSDLFFVDQYWFLYDLILMFIIVFGVLWVNKYLKIKVSYGVFCVVLLCAIFLSVILNVYLPVYYLIPNVTLNIKPLIFIIYFSFFLGGWGIYRYQDKFQSLFKKNNLILWLCVFSVIAIIFPLFYQPSHFVDSNFVKLGVGMLSWGINICLLMLSLLFQGKNSSVVSYLRASSYWMYLSQVPIVVIFQRLFEGVGWPPFVLWITILGCSFLVILLLFHFIVSRSRWFKWIR